MNYTDDQLKKALAKMLPKKIKLKLTIPVLDSEILHVCWLLEGTFSALETISYEIVFNDELCICGYEAIHASWQQRIIALAKVKGIEI